MAYNIPIRTRNLITRTGSSDIFDIANHLNVNIRFVETPKGINGFWKRILKRKFLFVNYNLEAWQQKAVIGHELGHILLHPTYCYFCQSGRSYYCSRRHENEADDFAVELSKYTMPSIDSNFISLFLKEGWK